MSKLELEQHEADALYGLLSEQSKIGTPDYSMSLNSVYSKLNKLPPDNIELHPTEQKYPEQTKRFREILDEMYQVHLKKNADYSPYNILVTGMRGCVTRLWDKSARFFNLMGLDIKTYVWTEEKMNMVEDEDVNQTIIDWANYCIITRIFREGKWGK